MFFSHLAKNAGDELDVAAFAPGASLRKEFAWARFHSRATGTSERLVVVLVYRLDRLSSSDQQLISLINELGERGVDPRSLTEPAIDTTSPMGRGLYGIIAVFAQLRVDTIGQDTLGRLAHARARVASVADPP